MGSHADTCRGDWWLFFRLILLIADTNVDVATLGTILATTEKSCATRGSVG